MKTTVFVDVDSLLDGDARDAAVEHLRRLHRDRSSLYACSDHGADVARSRVIGAGLADCFSGYVPKPAVWLGAPGQAPWIPTTIAQPDHLDDDTEANGPLDESIVSIRKRPGMFVGTTETPKHLLHLALRDRVAQFVKPGPRNVVVRMLSDNMLELVDDARADANDPRSLDTRCTELAESHLDLPVLNALCRRFEAEEWRDGVRTSVAFERGRRVRPPAAPSGLPRCGTRIRFTPAPRVFDNIAFDPSWVASRLRELALLDADATLTLEHGGELRCFRAPQGLANWVREHGGHAPARAIVHTGVHRCEVAWGWTTDSSGHTGGWVNSVRTRDGGSHVNALCQALLRQAPSSGHHLVAAVHVTMPFPRFKAPVKDCLDSPEIGALVRLCVRVGQLSLSGES